MLNNSCLLTEFQGALTSGKVLEDMGRYLTSIEWLTVWLFVSTYVAWFVVLYWVSAFSISLAMAQLALLIAFQASLQHEAIHGHPFKNHAANTLIAWPPLTLIIPYLRYRATHLDHHGNCDLTDPFEDPESNYCASEKWATRGLVCRAMLTFNNTLLGRLLVGPLIGTFSFLGSEVRKPTAEKLRGWLWHVPAAVVVLTVVTKSPTPLWAYAVAIYGSLSLLRIRTFLEHQAHELTRARSVIIEDRGPLAFLFLNNNLHAVHHAHPQVSWYRLPSLYQRNRARFIQLNEGYAYRSYAEVFRRYFFKRKDPVVHPLKN